MIIILFCPEAWLKPRTFQLSQGYRSFMPFFFVRTFQPLFLTTKRNFCCMYTIIWWFMPMGNIKPLLSKIACVRIYTLTPNQISISFSLGTHHIRWIWGWFSSMKNQRHLLFSSVWSKDSTDFIVCLLEVFSTLNTKDLLKHSD
mgnify:CR=1 FL=1